MNYLSGARIAGVWAMVFGSAFPGRADTIISISGSEEMSPGTPVNALELMDLGLDPNSFLFTGNTLYDYNGTYQVQVVGAIVDPSVTDSLDGATIQKVLLTIGDAGDGITSDQAIPSAVPEPRLVGAAGIAMLLGIWCYQERRSGASRSLS